jgi:hypothetical protein
VTDDNPTVLCTAEQFTEGRWADLVRGMSPEAVANLMKEGTRACESACDRRLVPFTNVVETQRAQALDIEDTVEAQLPLDPIAALGLSRAQSFGATDLVRHAWLREFPPRYPEMWSATISAIELRWSFSGTTPVDVTGIQFEPDTGHVRFQLGTFVPIGTTLRFTYSGGYSTIPADLVLAGKFMCAGIVVKQLDPATRQSGHDPDALRNEAMEILGPYVRG